MVSISYGHGQLYDFGSNFLFLGSSTYTANGAGAIGATTCNALTQADNYWNGCYIKFTSGANIGLTREITDFDAGTDTLTHDNFPQGCADGDTFLLSKWNIIEDGQTLATPASLYDDYLDLEATASAGNKKAYLTNEGTNHDFTTLSISTSTHKYFRYRFSSANTAKGRIVAVFSTYDYGETEATNITNEKAQLILDDTSSSTMTSATVALLAAKTLNYIRLYCNNLDDHVYYDFALVYKNDFTFPNGAYGVRGTAPNTNIRLQIPSRQTRINQMLGSDDFYIGYGCDLTNGFWTKDGLAVHPTGTDYVEGQVFYDIVHNAKDEPWQWLDTEREQMKVTLNPWNFTRSATGETLTDRIDLDFYEYRLSDAGNSLESYITRWGLDL